VRKGWKDFFFEVDGVVFIVDSADRGRFPEAKAELEVSWRRIRGPHARVPA